MVVWGKAPPVQFLRVYVRYVGNVPFLRQPYFGCAGGIIEGKGAICMGGSTVVGTMFSIKVGVGREVAIERTGGEMASKFLKVVFLGGDGDSDSTLFAKEEKNLRELSKSLSNSVLVGFESDSGFFLSNNSR